MRTPAILLFSLAAVGCAASPTEPLPPASHATPIVVEVERTSVSTGSVRIDWKVSGGTGLEFVVERRHADRPWKVVALLRPDGIGRMTLEDESVMPGETYSFGVRLPDGSEVQAAVSVEIPGSPTSP